jgi:hypothetical protein
MGTQMRSHPSFSGVTFGAISHRTAVNLLGIMSLHVLNGLFSARELAIAFHLLASEDLR